MKITSTCFLRSFLLQFTSVALLILACQNLAAQDDAAEVVLEPGDAQIGETAVGEAEAIEIDPFENLTEEERQLSLEMDEGLIQNRDELTDMLSRAISRYTADKEFAEAFDLFDQTEKLLEQNPSTAERATYKERIRAEKKKAQILWGESMYDDAMKRYTKLLQMEHSEDIIELGRALDVDLAYANNVYYLGVRPGRAADADELQRQVSRDPLKGDFYERVQKLRTKVGHLVDGEEYFENTSLDAVDPYYDKRNREVALLFRAGEFLYQNSRYMEARDKMEQILIKDPYNEQAITLLEKIYRKLYAIADLRVYNELLRESAQTEWTWVENIPDDKNIIATSGPEVYNGSENELFNKLNSIVIEHIEFSDSDITSAISLLKIRSKDADPDGKGINIINRIPNDESFKNKTITLELDQVPIYEIIRYICKQTGLSFRIDESDQTLTIGTGSDVNDMVTRYIPVRQGIIKRIVTDMGDVGNAVTFQEDLGTVDAAFANVDFDSTFTTGIAGPDSLNHVQAITAEALKQYFIDNGIPFEEGSSIAYNSRANKLTVKNTPENVRQLELAIRDMDVQNPLILIESKMVEIKMEDLEELGFDWTVTHINFEDARWNLTFASPQINAGFSNNKLINGLNLIPNFGPGGAWNVFLTVNAIDRTDRAEILCTPKVVTTTGRQAQIQMVRQMYFPENWSEPEISTSCGTSISFEPSYPEFGSAREVGTNLTVTPTLYSNNYTIRLNLNPSVTDLTGWSDYSYDYVIGDFASGENYPMTLKMPEISVREVETTIKVYDGQTVIIGGILSDSQGRVADRWPILGDLPLIGRFFTESASSADKDNLIISVTCRLISGDGIPVRSNAQNGLPDFRR